MVVWALLVPRYEAGLGERHRHGVHVRGGADDRPGARDAQVGDHIALTPEAAGRAEDPARHARVGPDDLIFGEVDG
ncbi:Uncharacterised protein [Mycobacteroides abscessus subsp. massiliense]|nr:Uncharacterised protein [Mycobacteroides abscessus subsp. massiliense]